VVTPDSRPGGAPAAVKLILDGQVPPFEGRVAARMTEALWFDTARDLADAGVDYFGPVGRKRRRQLAGFSKRDVADTTNVVWLDLDPPPDLPTDRRSLVAHAEKWLDLLRLWGLAPSVFVFSGRGCWAYWKLDRHVPQAEAEALMRRLYAQFRPGGAEHDVGRVARMPGSVNEKTGLRAFVMAVDAAGRWDPRKLRNLLPALDTPASPDGGATKAGYDRELKPGGRLPTIELPDDLREYIAARPPKRRRAGEGIDGSAVEQGLVARLVNAGCSDGQIALFFDHHRLPRHEEEKRRRRGYGWLATGIARARARVIPSPSSVSIGKGTYLDEEGQDGYGSRETGWQFRRWVILREMPEGLPKLELLAWVQERYGLGRSQARRELNWLEAEGYIGAVKDERDGRVRRVHRTDEGRRRLASWQRPGTPFAFRKGRPAAGAVPEPADPDRGPAEPVAGAAPGPREGATARAASAATASTNRPRADSAERLRRERSLINEVHRIHIPGNRWTYLQLLLPLDEWAYVRLHEQLRVGVDDEGFFVHRSFISPKDAALRGPDADDPLEERTLRDGGYTARDRLIGVAAELARSGAGFELATRTEKGKRVPSVGLVVQSHANFPAPLLALGPPEGSVVAARKRGKGVNTTYELRRAGDGIEVPSAHAPDLGALLDELADEDEMRAVLDSLPHGWRLVKRLPW
jgi:DNA-binding MarR family transcriptional regulator